MGAGQTVAGNGQVVQLRLGASGVIANGAGKGNVIIGGSGTATQNSYLDLNNFNETINGLVSVGTAAQAHVINGRTGVGNATTATLTLGDGDATTTFGGVIENGTGSLGLTKIGLGQQTLSGTNTYTGATTINGGTLALTSTGALAGGSAITINGSGAKFLQTSSTASTSAITQTLGTLDGTGTVGAVTVANDAANVIQNGNGGTTALTLGSLSFGGAATLNLREDGTASTADLAVTGALSTTPGSGTVMVNATGAWTNGSIYNLIGYGSFAGAITDFAKGTISGLGARQGANLVFSGSNIALAITGATPVWTGAASGVWSTTPVGTPYNWKLDTDGSSTEFLNNDATIFDDTATGTTTVMINDNTVTPASVTFNNSSKNYTLSGSNGISTGTLTKNGTGTLTIQNANTFSGATAVNAGIVNYQNATSFGGASAITMASGATVQAQGGIVGGTAAMTLSGSGASGQNGALVNVSGANSYAGLLTLAGNTIIAADSGTLNLTNSGTITGLNFNLTLAGAGNGTLAGIIGTGAGSLMKSGAGTWTVSGANTYSGGTTVSSGTLLVNNATGLGSNVSGSTVNIGSSGIVSLNANSGNPTYNYTFTGSGKILVDFTTLGNGGGDTVLNNFNAFSGTLEIGSANGGSNKVQIQSATPTALASATLQINNGGQYFTGANVNFGNITIIGSGNNENRGAIRLNGNGTTTGVLGGNISLLGNTAIGSEGGTLTGDISNGVTATSTLTMGTGNSGGTALLSGNLTNGTGTLALTQANGTTTLSGSNNTYSGATTISFGTLKAGSTGAFSANSAVTLANVASAVLDTTGFNTTVGSLAGGGTTGGSVTLGAATLTTGGDGTSTSYAGVIGGTGAVTKTGAGTQTLTGNNSYSGITTVSGGTLLVNGAHTGTGAVTVSNTGTVLGGSGTLAAAVNVGAGANLSPGATTAAGATAKFTVGALTLTSTSNFNVDVASATAGSGYDQVAANGAVSLDGSNLVLSVSGSGLNVGDKLYILDNGSSSSITGAFNGYANGSSISSGSDTFTISYFDSAPGSTVGNDISLTVTAVPEPATWLGGIFAVGALGFRLRRRAAAMFKGNAIAA